MKLIKRKNYIVFDRQRLAYLNPFEKAYCFYCGYVNGFLAYAVAIAGATESYWCAIKHKSFPGFVEEQHQKDFLEYGDAATFKKLYRSE